MAIAMGTPILPLVDRILDGRLRDLLQEYRTEGLTYETMSRRLAADHQIEVVSETMRKWCLELGVTDEPAEAAS